MTRSLIKFQARMAQALEGRRESGATAVEYGLLVALIAAVIIGVVVTLGGQINNAFQTVSTNLVGHGGN